MTASTTDQAVGPAPSRRARLRMWVRGMPRRTLWLNVGLAVLVIAAIVWAVLAIGDPGAPARVERTAMVTRGTVTASVTGSGNAASSASTPVNFTNSGMVTAVNVKPGDTVALGQVLATLDPTAAKAQLRTAQAQLAGAKAALAQAQAGPTAVQQQQDQLGVTSAQQGLSTAQKQLSQAQQQQNIDRSATAAAISAAQKKLSDDQRSSGVAVNNAHECSGSTGTQQNKTTTTTTTATPAPEPKPDCSPQVSSAQASGNTTVDADRAAVTSAQNAQKNTLLADQKAITSAQQSVTTSQNDIKSAQLTQQGNQHPETPDQIAGFQATVDGDQVGVDTAQTAVDEATLSAPQAGVVLAVNGKAGESTGNSSSSSTGSTGSTSATGATSSSASNASSAASSAGDGFVVLANTSKLAVTANIAEADASKIKLGQEAQVAFPATGTTATGSVTQITPQSTVTNNVVLYPITVSLDSAPPNVGVGATANLSVTTGSTDGVLVVPSAAITSVGDRHTVTVRRAAGDTVVPVQLGLQGDATTEVTGGVNQGDVLVLPSATPPTGASNGIPRAGG